jgi:uncharacterized small protein (DUF1192 family)
MGDGPSREELLSLVGELRAEVARLKEEIRRLRHDEHEVPPHHVDR